MKVVYNKFVPFKPFAAINLFGLIFIRKEHNPASERLINHESIHTRQMHELLCIFFVLFYFAEWLVRLIQYRNFMKAYRNISFEREAYANQSDLSYLSSRKSYSFLKYL